MGKLVDTAANAVRAVARDGMTVAVGGFGLSGNPSTLIRALVDSGAKDWALMLDTVGGISAVGTAATSH